MQTQQQQLCLACSSTIPANAKPASVYKHGCCSRLVCGNCLTQTPRLTTFCPHCEDAHAAFKKGPRGDVTRVGQVVFDAESALGEPPQENEEAGSAPPPYSEVNGSSTFVVDDQDEEEEEQGRAETPKIGKAPSLLLRQASKSSAGAEVDVAPQTADTSNTSSNTEQASSGLTSFRRKVDPHTTPTSSSSSRTASPSHNDASTRQYWLRKTDTLQSIAIRFSVSTNELCLLNSLPRAVLSTSPHLLHTRPFILLPAYAVEKQLATNPGLLKSLEGPPRKSAQEKSSAARRSAEARFRATLARGGGGGGETPADEKAARAYVGLAEDEMRMVDFGEGLDEAGLPRGYESDAFAVGGANGQDVEMQEAQLDTARRLRFDAVLRHALAKWEMDSDWERMQRANGMDPSSVSRPFVASTSVSATASSSSTVQESKASGSMSHWFTRALHGTPQRGEPTFTRTKPRHVVSLSSPVKLPTLLKQTFTTAHKGPVNVVRYNTTGRYLLTGSSDRTIKLWNAASSEEQQAIKVYTEHTHEVLALDVSRDNSRFVSGGADKSVYVWDVATGSVVRRFNGHIGKVNDVRFGGKDEHGSVVVVGGVDGVVRMYDLRAQGAWRPIMELKDASDGVTSLSVQQDRVYSGSVDGKLRCYDLRAGQLRTDTFAAPITSIYPSCLGTSTLVATLDSTLRLLDSRDGTLLQSYRGHQHQQYRCRAVLTNEEDAVIAGDEAGDLVGWDVVSSERVSVGSKERAHGKAVLWVECNPQDAREMVSAGADGVVKVWSTSI
ncbi:hypothetical protein EX895_004272 [Sporisorium graminicola]|uniref:Pyrrolo-quinoline quinone repeat domain-containing protein n=1 Tax=Sporisorium graminicola TaxID=280036 RepID=A0A4U7KQQ3_9BASI|nr:hypothetical protein EX895_004272 [Sporisorium graminicola]TKY86633.1 hypothetical protein EX895_004272 [Sporisorium graminicola]